MNSVSRWGDTVWPEQTTKQAPPSTKTAKLFAATIKPYTGPQPKSQVDKKIETHIIHGQYEDAIKIAKVQLQNAVDADSIEKWKKRIGHIYLHASRYNDAIRTFQTIEGWHARPNFLQGVAIAYSRKGEHQTALDLLEKYWQQDDGLLCCKARIYQRMQQYDIAIGLLKQCTCLYKEDSVTFTLARCYEAQGRYDDAVKVYLIAKKYNPAKALENLGRCYANMGDNTKAIAAFEELVQRWPEPHYFIPFGRFYQDIGEYDKAIATFKRSAEWARNSKLQMAIGCCYEAAGQFDKSANEFKNVRNFAHNTPAVLSYGRSLEKKGLYLEAEQAFQNVKDWQKNPEALLCLARVVQLRLERSGELSELHDEVANYFKLIPNWNENTYALKGLIWLYLRTDLLVRACYYLDLALARFPDVVDFYRLKTLYLTKMNDLEEGKDFALAAIQKFPQDTEIALRLLDF